MLLRNNKFLQYCFLFHIGGFAYGTIEIFGRGYSHISMMIAGGICFILIGLINEFNFEEIGIIKQMLISAVIITGIEFITGLIVNVWLKLNVWDYSDHSFNLMGQICLLYSIAWFFLSPLAIFMDDFIRYSIMGKEKPHYRIF